MTATIDLLPQSDVSYEKLQELQRRLLSGTKRGTVGWCRSGSGYELATPHGVIDVSPGVISIYDESGNRLRRFRPVTEQLFDAVAAYYDSMSSAVIDRLLAELEALDAAS